MKEQDGSLRAWIKTLPLIVLAIGLLGLGTLEFVKLGAGVPAISTLTVGVLVLGIWLTMVVTDWSKGKDEDEEIR